ncbi:hypothetical protein ACRYCC_15215 [Actinomadura scrupuli]|uniref:hypothetical protein n=1 Tax=Actinomadura scrupuli TaxID=559629 RepID=UPI003D95CFC7
MRRRLGYLAHYLTHPPTPHGEPRTRDFAWWHLARDTYTLTRTTQLILGLASGLAAGLTAALAVGLAVGLTVGLAVGLVLWLTVGLVAGLTVGLAAGLAVGLAAGLTLGLARWAEAPTATRQTATPLSSWRADRSLNLLRIATVGLAAGLTVGLGVGLATGLAAGLTLWLTGGLTGGLTVGDHHGWLAYLVATYQLHRAGRLPRHLMLFLDDAHRLGLLRAVGPIYQFRHADLQDHLAGTHEIPGTFVADRRPGLF